VADDAQKLRVIFFGVISYIILYLTLIVTLTVLNNFGAPFSTIMGLTMVLTTGGYFFVGFLVGRRSRENGAMHGLTVGGAGAVLIITALLVLASTVNFIGSVSDSFPVMLVMVLQSCLICCIGGAVGQSSRKR
jgi:hypothetical protein